MAKKSFKLILNSKITAFKKTITVDSDKSISIRSFLIGAISQNISIASNILESDDVLSTIQCLRTLGVKIKRIRPKNSEVNRLFGDNSLIKKYTNWNPKYSNLEGFKKGLEITIEWFQNPLNIELYKSGKYTI